MTLRRLAAWVVVLSLTLYSYSWWGSETSPLVHMLPISLASLSIWICLMVFERRMMRALKREERDPEGDIIEDDFADDEAEEAKAAEEPETPDAVEESQNAGLVEEPKSKGDTDG